MIVLDASAAIEWLLETKLGMQVGAAISSGTLSLHAPHLLDVEIGQVLRRFEAAGAISDARAAEALQDLEAMPLSRYPHELLLSRAWALRSNLTVYDAVYVALAEVLDAPLLTCDTRLASAPGHRARVELIG